MKKLKVVEDGIERFMTDAELAQYEQDAADEAAQKELQLQVEFAFISAQQKLLDLGLSSEEIEALSRR